MVILRIEHATPDFAAWKRAFDSDPVGRMQGGVKRYRIGRAIDEPNYVVIELEFAAREPATRMLASLRELWSRVEGQVMMNPQARILELVETREL